MDPRPDTAHLTVVALGGNAISVTGQEGNIDEQFEQARRTASALVDVIHAGHQLVITHGNGPQVGNILRRVELASHELYPIPLEVCVADTQAGMGYMIGQCLCNEAASRGQKLRTTTVVTTVRVDVDDPAFDHLTKPVGPRMTSQDARVHVDEDGWAVHEVEPGVFRRIVPSPQPREILELDAIDALIRSGVIVICCGGGGIPVLCEDGRFRGAPAVIDKDRTSELLATKLSAVRFVMVTDVEHVCVDFQQPTERALHQISVGEAESLAAEGQFAAGSMEPKIEAAARFVRSSRHQHAQALITSADKLLEALAGTTGTIISR